MLELFLIHAIILEVLRVLLDTHHLVHLNKTRCIFPNCVGYIGR